MLKQTANYKQYLKDTNLNNVEKMIVKKVDQKDETLLGLIKSKTKSLRYKNKVIFKAKVIAKKIMNESINLNFLLKKLNEDTMIHFLKLKKIILMKKLIQLKNKKQLWKICCKKLIKITNFYLYML